MWTSESYSDKLSPSYSIYCVLENHRFSLAIIDPDSAAVMAVQEVEGRDLLTSKTQLEQSLSKLRFVQNDFRSSFICVQPEQFTLLPSGGNKEDVEKAASLLLEKKHDTQQWSIEELRNETLSLVSINDESIFLNLDKLLPNSNIKSIPACLMTVLANTQARNSGIMCHWNIGQLQSVLCIMKEGKLQFLNHFEITHSEDLLYYTLNCFEQLGIKPEEVDVEVSGTLNRIKWNEEQVSQFLPGYQNGLPALRLKSDLMGEAALRRNHLLLNLVLCE